MAREVDIVLVIDVEATCWDGPQPKDQETEIIEIGICEMDVKTREILENKSILIKPEKSTVSQFCTELTSLTQEEVDKGISFKEACGQLKEKYQSKKRPWASFDAYDMNQFQKQCASRGIEYPFSAVHINVKTLFKIPLEGRHHRGVDDARNITKILQNILQ